MEEQVKREYELVAIINDAAVENDIDRLLATSTYEAEVANKEPAKLLQLAYPIKKQTPATLLVYHLKLFPEKVAQLKKDLSLQPHVLRAMITIKQQVPEKKAVVTFPDESADSTKKQSVEISSTEELEKTLKELET